VQQLAPVPTNATWGENAIRDSQLALIKHTFVYAAYRQNTLITHVRAASVRRSRPTTLSPAGREVLEKYRFLGGSASLVRSRRRRTLYMQPHGRLRPPSRGGVHLPLGIFRSVLGVMTTESEPRCTPMEALLEQIEPDEWDRRRARVETASLAVLNKTLTESVNRSYYRARELIDPAVVASAKGARILSWLISCELTRRGVPPCFRVLPEGDKMGVNGRYDLTLWDANWIATRYPNHRALKSRQQNLFKPDRFHGAVQFLFWGGKRPPWAISRVLGLTPEQQWECHYLQTGPVATKRRLIHAMQPGTESWMTEVEELKRQRGRSTLAKAATLRRLQQIWLCGSMASWAPQRTADLYEMQTGQQIGRNLAASLIAKVKDSQYRARALKREKSIS
jgi:hypothetical protein